jgi:vacuole morphology and inheritance protein 14
LAVPVIACLGNQDPQVRYYACEAMYNIASIAKSGILRFFNDLFGALSQLAADVDIQVSKGASHLNGLVKDIVTEYTSMDMPKMNEQHDTSGKAPLLFKLAQFIQLLSKCIYTSNGNTRMFLVDWLLVLNSVPNLELVVYLPEFLDGLLRFLNDSSQELRNKTDCLLKAFLHDINSIGSLSKSTIKEDESDTWIQGQGIDIDYARIIQILEPHIISESKFTE